MPIPNTRLNVRNTRSLDGDLIWKSIDKFYETYWSGLDCRIYANDVLIDEILSLQFQLQEAVMPLFKYSSYTYDTIVHGARRVSGSFSINYKRDSYVFGLLASLGRLEDDPTNIVSARNTEARRIASQGTATVETFLALAAGDGNVKRDKSNRVQIDPSLFRKVADDFEAEIWGRNPEGTSTNKKIQRVVDELEERTKADKPRFELANRFALNIQFSSTGITNTRRRKVSGSPGEREIAEIPVNTSSRIVGVALTGVERVIDDSGKPIMETYTFIGRDLI